MTISGASIFAMKDAQGFPLSLAFFECERRELMIDWLGFIAAARRAGWWDFQTIAAISEAFSDSCAWSDKRAEIIARIKAWVVLTPHPNA